MNAIIKKGSALTLLLLLFAFRLYAAVTLERNDEFFSKYKSTIWNSKDGLPGNTVLDAMHSSFGTMYFGTYDGLFIFDGYDFVTVAKGIEDSVNFVSARVVFEDSRGYIWVGSNDEGVTRLKIKPEAKQFDVYSGLPSNSVLSICEDKDGNVWIATSSGIVYITPDDTVVVPDGADRIYNDSFLEVYKLMCDDAGRIWLLTETKDGLFVYENGEIQKYKRNLTVTENTVLSFIQVGDGNYYAGLDGQRILKIGDKEEEIYDVDVDGRNFEIKDLLFDASSNLWIATSSGMVVITSDGKLAFKESLSGQKSDIIYKVYQDRECNIWVCTDRGGLVKLNESRFRFRKMSSSVNGITGDWMRECKWIACDDGLYCYRNDGFVENEVTERFKGIRVRDVEFSDKNNLLISTYSTSGFAVYSMDGRLTVFDSQKSPVKSAKCRVSMQSSKGDFYVGTVQGLYILDENGKLIRMIDRSSGISNHYIMCIYEDDDGYIWVGTDGGGVFVLKDYEIVRKYTHEDGLAGNIIFKITSLEKDGYMWFCTGSGLSLLRDGKFFSFDASTGLETNSVSQVILDKKNYVWFTCNKGIFSVKYRDLIGYSEGAIDKIIPKKYSVEDGLGSSSTTSTAKSYEDDFGKMWFSMVDGFTVYNPYQKTPVKKAPKPVYEMTIIDGIEYEYMNRPIVIEPGAKRVTFVYSGISFRNTNQIIYCSMLEGFDKEYSPWTYDKDVSYTNLKPGTYSFYLRAMNGDEYSAVLENPVIVIKKPYIYQTARFWFAIGLLVLMVLSMVVAYNVTTSMHYHKQLEEEVKNRTKELLELKKSLEQQVEDRTGRLKQVTLEVTEALARTIDAKDPYTKGHSSRVAQYSKMLAEALGKDPSYVERIYVAANLHDIGKIGIPDSIINKNGPLTKEEEDIVRMHPVIGGEILKDITMMPEIAVVARYHHERFDGKGYPFRLRGNEIPEIARIVCVADTYDAMTSNRSYRSYISQKEARREIEMGIGTQFDPEIARKMLELIDDDTEYKMHES